MRRLQNKSFRHRKVQVQRILCSRNLEGVIFFNMNNIRYLSGFTGSEGILCLLEKQSVLFVDGRYTEQAQKETQGIKIIEGSDKLNTAARWLAKTDLRRIGIESDAVTLKQFQDLARDLKRKHLVPLYDDLRDLRAVKDETEITLMRKAARISSLAIQSVLNRLRPGWKEKDVALELEWEARKQGADGIAFETIVASGENTSFPHAKPTKRTIKNGDFVLIDFGVKCQGYCSDESCTIAFGKLTEQQKNAYQVVKTARDRALQMASARLSAAELDQQVRNVFGKQYGRYFVHGTGHGVGLDIHEYPRLSRGSADALKPQMVLTIEPGLYLPGLWGIRIEDTILLKENGCEKLTKMSKELTIINE